MTLESLGNFIRQPDNENSFHRIYRAHLLQEKMVELLGAGVTVTLATLMACLGGGGRLGIDAERLPVGATAFLLKHKPALEEGSTEWEVELERKKEEFSIARGYVCNARATEYHLTSITIKGAIK